MLGFHDWQGNETSFKSCDKIRAFILQQDWSMVRHHFSNWTGNQICSPKNIFHPRNIDSIKEIVKRACTEGAVVRAFGARHAFGDFIVNDDYLIDMTHFNNITIDWNKKTIRAEAGATIGDINKQLVASQLQLATMPVIQDPTIAGLVSTASHGAGTATICDLVIAIELIDGAGNIRLLTENDAAFSAVLGSVGVMGIITAVTLRCEELTVSEQVTCMRTLEKILPEYKKNRSLHNAYWFFWSPYLNENDQHAGGNF